MTRLCIIWLNVEVTYFLKIINPLNEFKIAKKNFIYNRINFNCAKVAI